jgi:hypothetical protein
MRFALHTELALSRTRNTPMPQSSGRWRLTGANTFLALTEGIYVSPFKETDVHGKRRYS